MTYSAVQPLCDDCWDEACPETPSPREDRGDRETCCGCGEETWSGIYVRVDPANTPFPTRTKE